jgi:DNA-binding response OmpR family regulator
MANLVLDRRFQSALINNSEVVLNPLEFEVLWILSAFKGQLVSMKKLTGRLEYLEEDLDTRMVKSTLESLAEKLPLHHIARQGNGCMLMTK